MGTLPTIYKEQGVKRVNPQGVESSGTTNSITTARSVVGQRGGRTVTPENLSTRESRNTIAFCCVFSLGSFSLHMNMFTADLSGLDQSMMYTFPASDLSFLTPQDQRQARRRSTYGRLKLDTQRLCMTQERARKTDGIWE